MPAQWTADVIGEMHLKKISKKHLAKQLGVTPEYVSMVLNGHREPDGAEMKFRAAVRDFSIPIEQDDHTTHRVQ